MYKFKTQKGFEKYLLKKYPYLKHRLNNGFITLPCNCNVSGYCRGWATVDDDEKSIRLHIQEVFRRVTGCFSVKEWMMRNANKSRGKRIFAVDAVDGAGASKKQIYRVCQIY